MSSLYEFDTEVSAGSGNFVYGYAGEVLGVHALVYMAANGTWRLADADSAATMPALGITMDAAALGGEARILQKGYIESATWAWTVAGTLYASTTAGELTQTAPAGVSDVIQAIGIPITATMIYFSPGLGGAGGEGECALLPGATAYVGFDECLSSHANYFLCDGTADDVQINQAIVYVSGMGRGTVQFGEGTYDVSGVIGVASNVSLNLSQAVLRETNGADLVQMIYLNGATDITITGGRLDGNRANQAAGGHGIQLRYLADPTGKVVIRDTIIEHFRDRSLYIQMNGDYTVEVVVDGVSIRDSAGYPIYAVGANDLEVSNIIVDDSGAATFSGCYRTVIINSIFKGNPNAGTAGFNCGMWVTGCLNMDISNCDFYDNAYGGVLVSQGVNIQFSNCNAFDNAFGFMIAHIDTDNVSFTGCNGYNNDNVGWVTSDGARYVTITGGSAMSNDTGGIGIAFGDTTVTGMLIMNNDGPGISLGSATGGATYCVIVGNRILDDQGVQTQTYAISEIHGNSNHNLIVGNDLRDNLTGSLNLLGTNTKAFDNKVDGTSTIVAGVEIPSREWLVTYGAGGISVAGDVPLAAITNGQSAAVGFECPSDLQQLVRAYLKVLPNATQGAANWDLNSDYGGVGQAPNTHTEVDAATTYNVTNNQWYDIELIALGFFANLAVGDRGGIRMTVSTAGHDASVFSLIFEYL